METIIVTGGAGFIGSNFIRFWIEKYPLSRVINLDVLTYAGYEKSLEDIKVKYSDQYLFVKGDIGNYDLIRELIRIYNPSIIINFAAESHNSRALLDPDIFFKTNTLGAQSLFRAALDGKVPRVHHISTCEVFGDMDIEATTSFNEQSPYRPRTPYNAAKAGGDLAARAYYETFNLPITISHCSNNYGPYQFPEKMIPYFIIQALKKEKLPLYKNSTNQREWLHVIDHCEAIDLILKKGEVGEIYNIGSGREASIEEIADIILDHLKIDKSMKKYVPDRPGHDRRYLLDSNKIQRTLGWKPRYQFEKSMHDTIDWYVSNSEWWEPLLKRLEINESQWKEEKPANH